MLSLTNFGGFSALIAVMVDPRRSPVNQVTARFCPAAGKERSAEGGTEETPVMDALKRRIAADGKSLGHGILRVDGFINHRVDPALMQERGPGRARCFAQAGAIS